MFVEPLEKLLMAEEFWEFSQLPEHEGRKLELDDGVIIEMASNTTNTIVAGRAIYYLNAFVIPNDLGYVTVPDGGYKLAPRKVRQPDAAFIAKERFTAFGEPLFQLAPDLAIEVVSPDEDILKKAREYLSAGTRLVWAIYPDEKIVYVFHPPRDGELWLQELGVEDTLDGEDVLPGFKLKVRDLFPV